ncbi:hypothetical protein GC194_11865 [bacterium]|nr:hypothetical protein [bacterium]
MKESLFFLKLHSKRWYRFLGELGPFRVFFLLVLFSLFLRFVWLQFVDGNGVLGLSFALFPFVIQQGRKDHHLLQLASLKSAMVYGFLYLVISLPVMLMFLLFGHYYLLAALLAVCALVPFMPGKKISIDHWFINLGNFLPKEYFEWRSGLRQYGLALIVLFISGLALSVFRGAVPVIIFFITLNTAVFYLHAESKELLTAMSSSAKGLLFRKIKGFLLIFYLLILPLVLLDLYFHPELWPVILYVIVVSFFAGTNAILFKYAAYRQGERFDNNIAIQSLMTAFFLLPVLFPVPIVMAIINFKKSIKNLSLYFENGN